MVLIMSWLTVVLVLGTAILAYSDDNYAVLKGYTPEKGPVIITVKVPDLFDINSVTIGDKLFLNEKKINNNICKSTNELNVSKHIT